MATAISALITKARQHADMQDSDFIDADTALEWTQEAYKSLYIMMATKFVELFVSGPEAVTVADGSSSVSLPDDFLMLRHIEKDGKPVQKFGFGAKGSLKAKNEYRVVGNALHAQPGAYDIWYVKQPATKLLSDEIDNEMEPFKDWIAYQVGIQMLITEESNPAGLAALQERVEERMNDAVENRDISGQDQIIDVRGGYHGDEDDWRFQ